eukprot:scaffold107631_cov78-Phaeocystis_antarctica.AAC.1
MVRRQITTAWEALRARQAAAATVLRCRRLDHATRTVVNRGGFLGQRGGVLQFNLQCMTITQCAQRR